MPCSTRSVFVNWISSYCTTLDEVAPRVEEIEPPPGTDLDACGLERSARGRLVLDDEAEVTGAICFH